MKTTLTVCAFIISLCFAGNFSDNPEDKPLAPLHKETVKICPKCEDTSCIYYQIETEIISAGGDGTDQQILDAAQRVFILRGITDSVQIKNVLSNYYL